MDINDMDTYPAHKHPVHPPELPCPFCGSSEFALVLPNGRVECFTCEFSVMEATWNLNGRKYLDAMARGKVVPLARAHCHR